MRQTWSMKILEVSCSFSLFCYAGHQNRTNSSLQSCFIFFAVALDVVSEVAEHANRAIKEAVE